MSDEELYNHTLELQEVPLPPTVDLFPKIAFLFLVRGPIPLAALWERFFRGHEGKYSIYVHAHPDFKVNPGQVPNIFMDRNIPSQLVLWKDFSLVRAGKRLLANALRDRGNERFVLVSDSCIPLFNFTFTYAFLAGSPQDFLDRNQDHRTWHHSLEPEIRWGELTKGIHWFALRRNAALHAVADAKYFRKLRHHCNPDKSPPHCVHYFPDEYYLQTVLYNSAFRGRLAPRSLTYNFFPLYSAHPQVYAANNTNILTALKRMQEYSCRYRGEETAPCFLFSRKWDPSALKLLLNLARIVSKY